MRILEFETSDVLHESERCVLYRVQEKDGQPSVILKVLKGEHPSRQTLARFRQEFEIAREIASPHVITTHRLESWHGTLVGVCEDFGGESLEAWIHRDRPALREALNVALAICRGLADIHKRGIVHRNVRASHVLWNRATGAVKLIDFGIASRLESEVAEPRAPRVLEGTLAYMSPEQTGRMNRPVDNRTDLYSLGVTLYELLTGRRPFESADPLEIIHGHIARQPVGPDRLDPGIPAAVSSIVLKLLQKNAEDRYQSAVGTGDDLAECAKQLDAEGAIHPFPLARTDARGRFRIPAKLYGREADVAALSRTFQGVLAGELAFTLVSGHSGVGKSSLVQELYRPLAVARGRYIAGKYDQYQRSIPYSAVGRAFNALCDQLLGESPEVLAEWRQRILKVVGGQGRALIEVIPDLELIIGPQPPMPQSDPQSAQNLFNQVCQDFVQAICQPDEPLVIFLDDLQWSDLSSLALIRTVLKNPRIRGLHLVGAYRDNEVDSNHPLFLLLDEINTAGLAVATVHLGNLTLASVTTLTADALSLSEGDASSLARIIHAKTAGNAFFTTEFLKALHAEGLLDFNRADRQWEWDLDQIQARQASENVVELMAGRIRALPVGTQQLLRLAACIGAVFDLKTLAVISGGIDHMSLVADALLPAIQLGVITEIHERGGAAGLDVHGSRWRFQHDRVQQAAYSLIPELERPRVHLGIARQLLGNAKGDYAEDGLFEIVGHLRNGASLLTDGGEKLRAAHLNLLAGEKARKASAHHASLDFFRSARNFLPGGAFDSDYQLAFQIHVALAKSCSVAGEFAEAEALYPIILRHARTLMDKVQIHSVQMDDYHLQGHYDRAIDVQRTTLLLLGEPVPLGEPALSAAIDEELALSPQYLQGRAIADLADAQEVESPEIDATLKVLMSMWMSAYLVSREDLVQWSSAKLANLSLQHGTGEVAAFAYVQYGYLCVTRLQRFEEGHEYGQLALTLADRYESLEMRGKIYFLFGIFISHWTKHVSLSTEAMRKGYLFSVAAGDWTYAVYGAANVVSNLIIAGVHCDEVAAEAQRYLRFLQDKATVGLNSFFLPGGYCALLNLQGRTAAPDSFDCEFLDEKRFHEALGHLPIVEAWFYAVKIRSLYLHGCFQAGAEVIPKAEAVAEGVPAQVKVPEAYFYSCLMLASAQHFVHDPDSRTRYWALFHKYEVQMKIWADHCPDNYLHKYCLIVAERTRVEGGPVDEVLGWYDRAIQSAGDGRFPNIVALAHELKGRFWLQKKRQSYALSDMKEAHYGYQLWGASTKVAMLEKEFQGLPVRSGEGATYDTAQLDLLSAHKASRAISEKIELDDLIQTMMSIVMESAGADRGLILHEREGRWRIQAEAVFAQKGVRVVSTPSPVAETSPGGAEGAPFALVHYVVRTKTSLTVDDPAKDLRFGHDPYIMTVQPRSIFCAPMLHQGRMIGILYLENKLDRGVFTSDRRDLVDVLTGQMAISLENASLYANLKNTVVKQERMMAELQRHQEKLVQSNDDLANQRMQLAAQGVELRALNVEVVNSNRELEAFSYSVAHDLRAPLRAVDGFSHILLEDHLDRLDPEGRRVLGVISGETRRMGQLLDDLLGFFRLGRQTMDSSSIDLTALAQAVFEEHSARAPGRILHLELAPLPPAHGDRAMLRVVFNNLISNALKFTKGRDRAVIDIGSCQDDGETVYYVKDNGVGFDMQYVHQLFGVFQRLHSAEEFEGTGVGLALVQRVIHRHGGRVWAEGRVNEGATFCFALPDVKGTP